MIPKGLLPDDMVDRAFIAGGWAACPALASDMDIWVQVDGGDPEDITGVEEALAEARERILHHLRWRKHPVWRIEAEDVTERAPGYTESGYFTTQKVAVVRTGPLLRKDTPVFHIMVTDGGVEDVLGNFDVSTHQVAILANGKVVRGEEFTTVNQPPYAIRMNDKTPVRLKKITERFAKVDL